LRLYPNLLELQSVFPSLLVIPAPGAFFAGNLRRSAALKITMQNKSAQEKPEVIETTDARQGVTGHGVRYVLLFGTVGAMLGFFLAYLFF
jgi:heme/copper-type cytochrome/quinol oxidase subunit 1